MHVIKGKFETRKTCRLCKSSSLTLILDLGLLPLAGNYLLKKDLGKEEFFPTRVYFCSSCYLVQLVDVITPKKIFEDYRYLSSMSLEKHFEEYAREMSELINKGSFAVEIGSNDGVLLGPLKKRGFKVLGVDPAKNVAKVATDRGLPTIINFFSQSVAKAIVKTNGQADAIFANNVLAHIDDMDEIGNAVKILLKDTGIFVFEVHYLLDLIEGLQYDFFYPGEHLTYYSINPIIRFWDKFGLDVFKVERIPIHSGSIRVYLRNKNRNSKIDKSVFDLLKLEERRKLNRMETYEKFSKEVGNHKQKLKTLINSLKKESKQISGFGAAGRGNTLLNACGIGNSLIDCIYDKSPERYGRFTPGTHILIVDSDKFDESNSDFSLILAWSYTSVIIEKEEEFLKRGGKFIIPLPKIKIIE